MQKATDDRVIWHPDGPPVSALYDDPYFSLQDGLAETGHVFLAGNGLPERLRDGFQVAELGFGTGLNALAVWDAWLGTGRDGTVRFTSFEAHPMAVDAMRRALGQWPRLGNLAERLCAAWAEGQRVMDFGAFRLDVVVGDASGTVRAWNGRADAWFLDGFSPAKNPALWTAEILADVGAHTAPGGTAATYSAAGHVRRNLEAAGFVVERVPGFGRKRHMTVARR